MSRLMCGLMTNKLKEGRVLPLSLWEFENSGHITLPSAPLHLALSEDQAQAQHRVCYVNLYN